MFGLGQGYYTVYEELFGMLARQEEAAYAKREDRGRNAHDAVQPPRCGAST